ncbi:MAG: hypothetical protein IT169_06205 [Bryobacterales bacterium]|nr:hypothetical protein [Bryobacterales bacterium]
MKRTLMSTNRYFSLLAAILLLGMAAWAGIEAKTYPLQPGEYLLQVLPRVQGGTYLIVGQSAGVANGIVSPTFLDTDRFLMSSGALLGGVRLHVVRLDAMDREVARFSVGGEGYTSFKAALLDSDGSLVILGETSDRAFPVKNPLLPLAIPQEGNAFTRWGFLAKSDPAGSGIVTSTLIGGVELADEMFSNGTIPLDLTRDGAGNVYVTGITSHRDFPVTANAYKKDPRFDIEEKESEGFLLKVDRHLRSLLYSTFLGSDALPSHTCREGGPCGLLPSRIQNAAVAVRVGAGQQPWVLLSTTGEALAATPGAYAADPEHAAPTPSNPLVDPRGRESVSLVKLDAQGSSVIVSAFMGEPGPWNLSPPNSLALLSGGSPVVLFDRGSMPGKTIEFLKLLPDASAATAHYTLEPRGGGVVSRYLVAAADNSLWLSGNFYRIVRSPVPLDSTPGLSANLDERDENRVGFEGIAPTVDLGNDFLLRISGEDLQPRSLWMLPNPLAGPLRATPFGVEMASTEGIVTSVPYPGQPGTAILSVSNSALPRAQATVSPYEFLTLEGVGLGLPDAAPPQFDRFGNLPRVHEGVRVTLDGVASPLLSVSTNAVTLIAPETLAAKAEAAPVELSLESGGQVVARYPLFANRANPRFFRADPSIVSQRAAAVNQDGSVNSFERPAKPGEIISLFLNGAGAPTAAVPAGLRMPVAGSWTTLRPKVSGYGSFQLDSENDTPWEVSYFGIAPGLASGTLQMNVRIPRDLHFVGEDAIPSWTATLFVDFLPATPASPGEPEPDSPRDSISIWVRR